MRNEDYDRELLVAVTLICVMIATTANLFEGASPSSAVKAAFAPQAGADITPVRVIGTPFVPNINPGQR